MPALLLMSSIAHRSFDLRTVPNRWPDTASRKVGFPMAAGDDQAFARRGRCAASSGLPSVVRSRHERVIVKQCRRRVERRPNSASAHRHGQRARVGRRMGRSATSRSCAKGERRGSIGFSRATHARSRSQATTCPSRRSPRVVPCDSSGRPPVKRQWVKALPSGDLTRRK